MTLCVNAGDVKGCWQGMCLCLFFLSFLLLITSYSYKCVAGQRDWGCSDHSSCLVYLRFLGVPIPYSFLFLGNGRCLPCFFPVLFSQLYTLFYQPVFFLLWLAAPYTHWTPGEAFIVCVVLPPVRSYCIHPALASRDTFLPVLPLLVAVGLSLALPSAAISLLLVHLPGAGPCGLLQIFPLSFLYKPLPSPQMFCRNLL